MKEEEPQLLGTGVDALKSDIRVTGIALQKHQCPCTDR